MPPPHALINHMSLEPKIMEPRKLQRRGWSTCQIRGFLAAQRATLSCHGPYSKASLVSFSSSFGHRFLGRLLQVCLGTMKALLMKKTTVLVRGRKKKPNIFAGSHIIVRSAQGPFIAWIWFGRSLCRTVSSVLVNMIKFDPTSLNWNVYANSICSSMKKVQCVGFRGKAWLKEVESDFHNCVFIGA